MPQEFIYEEILKPIFAQSALAEQALELCRPFLAIYAFLCSCSKEKVLISPRELQMMALLVLSQQPQDLEKAAKYYAYQLAIPFSSQKNIVPN